MAKDGSDILHAPPAGRGRAARALTLVVAVAMAAMVGALGAASAVAAAAPRARPHAASPARGAAPRPGTMLALALPLRADLGGLERFAAAVTTPGSPRYGDYLSVAALARRFGASSSERSRVLRYLLTERAVHPRIDATGLFADAEMSIGQADRLFATSLATIHSGRAGTFLAPGAPERIPAALAGAVTGVVGLDTQPLFGSPQVQVAGPARWLRAAASSGSPDAGSGYEQRTGTPSGCSAATGRSGFTPNQYLSAYGYTPLQSAGIEGQGERVALIEIDGFKYSDLRRFATCFGLATPAINGYGVGLKKPLAPGPESTLDLDVLAAAAPDLKAVDVYESSPDAVDVLRALTAPLQNAKSKPDIISASLGACEAATFAAVGEAGLRTVEASLALAAASGITVLASSGDDGSSSCVEPNGDPLPALEVNFPASSPWITGVGGTNIVLNAANQITSQEVWNDSPAVAAAGGGGLSDIFTRPSFQKSFVVPNRRAVPDVSMLADIAPGYEIYCTSAACLSQDGGTAWAEVGGTSAAAPLLAGGIALVDQHLRQLGRQDVGQANPLLYKIAHSAAASSVLYDVTLNNNDLGVSISGTPLGCCSAEPGYDYASGLGSVNITGLAQTAVSLMPRIVSVGLSLPRQSAPLRAGRLLARVSCSGRCLFGAFAHIQVGRSRHLITQQSAGYLLGRAGARTISIRLSTSTLRVLRTALARHEAVTATLYAVTLEPSGTVAARTRGLTLHIRR
jgi:subtilase family serine protease